MDLSRLEKDIEGVVVKINESPDLIHYPYHNLDHTENVVAHVREIGSFYLLNETDFFIVTVAAWFHDIGHLYGVMQGHEARGVLIMEQYLQEVSKEVTALIAECIMATQFGYHPRNLREEIICDADTYHFGTSVFRQTDVLVHKEMEMRTGKTFPNWAVQSLQTLKTHTFYTDYCKRKLDQGKQQNIRWLESLIHLA